MRRGGPRRQGRTLPRCFPAWQSHQRRRRKRACSGRISSFPAHICGRRRGNRRHQHKEGKKPVKIGASALGRRAAAAAERQRAARAAAPASAARCDPLFRCSTPGPRRRRARERRKGSSARARARAGRPAQKRSARSRSPCRRPKAPFRQQQQQPRQQQPTTTKRSSALSFRGRWAHRLLRRRAGSPHSPSPSPNGSGALRFTSPAP